MDPTPVFLLVEPSPILRLRLREWLERVLTGYSIFIAANGLDALWLASQEEPSHILIDIYLPDLTGLEVVRQMRQGPPAARIIATAWYESRFFLEQVLSAGADRFIPNHKLHTELLPLLAVVEDESRDGVKHNEQD